MPLSGPTPETPRFVSLLDAILSHALDPSTASLEAVGSPVDRPPAHVAVERGVAWPMLTCDPGSAAAFNLLAPLWDRAFDPDTVVVTDRAGHARPAYRGLLGYSLFQAIRASDRVLVGDPATVADRWTAALVPELAAVNVVRGAGGPDIPASAGDVAVRAAWAAAAVIAGGDLSQDDRVVAAGRRFLLGLAARQQPSGTFLKPGRADNLESFWFHELQLLHVVAAQGLQWRDEALLAAARRSAAYHVAETQPDHATNEPWGLPGFLCDAESAVMADQLLHAAGVQQPGRAGGVTLILLADTLYSLRRYRAR